MGRGSATEWSSRVFVAELLKKPQIRVFSGTLGEFLTDDQLIVLSQLRDAKLLQFEVGFSGFTNWRFWVKKKFDLVGGQGVSKRIGFSIGG